MKAGSLRRAWVRLRRAPQSTKHGMWVGPAATWKSCHSEGPNQGAVFFYQAGLHCSVRARMLGDWRWALAFETRRYLCPGPTVDVNHRRPDWPGSQCNWTVSTHTCRSVVRSPPRTWCYIVSLFTEPRSWTYGNVKKRVPVPTCTLIGLWTLDWQLE